MPRTVDVPDRNDAMRIAVAVLLASLTIAMFGFGERYVGVAADLVSGDFTGPNWRERGAGIDSFAEGTLTLRATDRMTRTGIDYLMPRPSNADQLRLAADVRIEGVARNLQPYANARVFLVQITASGRSQWHLPHHLFNESGTRDWQTLEEVFRLDPATERLRLSITLDRVPGTLQVRNLELQPVEEAPWVPASRIVLLLLWAGYLVWCIGSILRQPAPAWLRLAGGLLVIGILAGGLLPHGSKTLFLDGLAGLQPAETTGPNVAPARPAQNLTDIQDTDGLHWPALHKLGHVAAFALLTVAALGLSNRGSLVRRVVPVLGFAGITETLQLLSLDRTGSLIDVGIDAVGVVLALSMLPVWRRLRRRLAIRS